MQNILQKDLEALILSIYILSRCYKLYKTNTSNYQLDIEHTSFFNKNTYFQKLTAS